MELKLERKVKATSPTRLPRKTMQPADPSPQQEENENQSLNPPSPQSGQPDRGEGRVRGVAFARHLRKNRTPQEVKLWARLRDRRLNGYKFRRQHPIRA